METLKQLLNPLRSHVGFTLATVVTLGACWGTCLAVVVLFQSSFLRPPPFADVEELVWVRSHMPSERINPGIILELERDFGGADQVAAYTAWKIESPMEVSSNHSVAANASVVTVNLMEVLRIGAHGGRTFIPEDDAAGGATPMLISHRFWHEAFGADESVIDGIFNLDGQPARLIGVLPPGIHGPSTTETVDAYIPLGHFEHFFGEGFFTNLNFHTMAGVLRLPAERDRGELAQRLETLFVNYTDRNPDKHPLYPRIYDWRADAAQRRIDLFQTFRLYGAVTVSLFLIAIANSVILILLRTAWRAPEILTKISLGAGRQHLLREFAIEAVVLCFLTAVVAAALCWALLSAVTDFLPNAVPPQGLQVFSPPLITIAVVTLVLQGLLFTAIPSAWIRRMRPGDITREGRGTSRRIRALPALAVLQVAVTTILVIFSFQFVFTAYRIAHFDPGYRTDGIVTFSYDLRYLNLPDYDEWDVVHQAVETAVESLPEVATVAWGNLDFLGPTNGADLYYEEDIVSDDRPPLNITYTISADLGFMELMDIQIIEGRDFHFSDREAEGYVALATHSFVAAFFPNEDPIGKRIRLLGRDSPLTTIIGITEDVRVFPFDDNSPVLVEFAWGGTIFAEVRGSIEHAKRAIDTLFAEEFGHIGIPPVRSVKERIYENTQDTHIAARIVTATAALAVMLSLFGLYVVFSFSTTLRRRDYAIRMAMGATTGQIAAYAGRGFATVCAIGLAAGILGTILIAPHAGGALTQDAPNEPMAYAVALFFVATLGGAVSVASALRTLRIDPARELLD